MPNKIEVIAALLEISKDPGMILKTLRYEFGEKYLAQQIYKVKKAWYKIAEMECNGCMKEIEKRMATIGIADDDITRFSKLSMGERCSLQYRVRSDHNREPEKHLSSYHEFLVNNEIVPQYVCQLRAPMANIMEMQARQKQKLLEKLSSGWSINAEEIFDQMEKGLKNYETIKHGELAAWLSMATGRRMSEIFFSATLEPSSDAGHAYVNGLLKKKKIEQTRRSIPILLPFEVIRKALQYLRSIKTFKTAEEVNTSMSSGLSRITHQILGKDRKFHDFRNIYSIMAYDLLAKTEETFPFFAMNALGHESISSQMHYSSVKLVWKNKSKFEKMWKKMMSVK